MEKEFKYEEPKLLELDAMFLHGEGGEYNDVSIDKFEASYDDEEEEHETMEL